MDLKTERWIENTEGESSDEDKIPKKIDHTQNYQCW